MNIYDAIMKAADGIENNPHRFKFESMATPGDCGSPGCALGWIGLYTGHRMHSVSFDALGLEDSTNERNGDRTFYQRMNALSDSDGWHSNAAICAQTLRLYAAKYHKPAIIGIPDEVRAIFQDARREEA